MAMAAATSCFALSCKPKSVSLHGGGSGSSSSTGGGRVFSLRFRPLAFSSSLSFTAFPKGGTFLTVVEKAAVAAPPRRSIVCEAAPKKKADSAAKRARQAEKRRIYNKARKSEIKTRMKKALEDLDVLRKKSDPQAEEILPIEKLIAEAYSAIDKAVKVGTLHRNTGARRKSRLARRKKAVEIHHGWYTPAPAAATAA